MNKTIYKQLDSRWAKKPYPTAKSTFGATGCGCCSCTHIAIEQTSKASWTPEKLRPYMVSKGYAVAGQGTTWNGITETLKYIGHDKVVRIWNDPMTEAWKELNKGNRMGVILFSKGYGGTKKILWTTAGHYVAFTNYKLENGKHYFYCKDSGGRNHDGWYNYEDHMKGVVSKVWIVERISEEKSKYTGELPTMSTTKEVSVIEDAIAWGLKIASDNTFIYKKWNSKDPNTKKCSWCDPELIKITKYRGANCIGFGGAMLHHGGGAPVPCRCNGLCAGTEYYDKVTLATWKKRNGSCWKQLSKAQRGCTIVCFDKDTGKYRHIATSLGGGYILDATSSHGIAKRKSSLSNYKKKYFLCTATKKVTTDLVYKKGDSGENVKKIQNFLNWYGQYGLEADGIFGDATEKAIKNFQKAVGLEQTGRWGKLTNAKAKEVEK